MKPQRQAREFWCFISYRHADNQQQGRQWATWLHHMLETYEVPADLVGRTNLRGETIPARIYPVFRDEEELPADADLSRPIVSALTNSRCLLVICSPRACESRFVADEIARFKAMGKSDRVIAAIIAGEPNASTDPAKIEKQLSECFPEPLRFEVDEDMRISNRQAEPVAADFRIEETGEEGWVNPQSYRSHMLSQGVSTAHINERLQVHAKRMELMKLKVIAGVLLVDLGELTKRDQAYQLELAKKRARLLRQWLAAVALLTLVAVVTSIIAWRNEKKVVLLNQVQERNLKEASWSSFHQADRLFAEADASHDDTLAVGKIHEAMLHLARSIKFNETNQVARERFAWELGLRRSSLVRPSVTLPHQSAVGWAVFSNDGRKILTADAGDTVRVWDAQTHEIISTSLPGNRLWKSQAMEAIDELSPYAEFSPDSDQFLTLCLEKRVQVWDSKTGKILHSLTHPDLVRSAVYSANGKMILTTSDDTKARIWNAATARVTRLIPCDEYLPYTMFLGDGAKVASAVGKTVSVYDSATGDKLQSIELAERITAMTCSAQGEFIAAVDRKNVIHILQLPQNVAVASYPLKSPARQLFISPDGFRVVALCADQSAVVVGVPSGKEIAIVRHDKPIIHCAFSKDGRLFATSSWDKTAKVWQADNGKPVVTLLHGNWVNALGFHPDGGSVVTACVDFSARIWPLPIAAPCVSLVHSQSVSEVSFKKDSALLISTSADRTAKIWNVADGSLKLSLTGDNWLNHAIMSPDGRFVVTTDLTKNMTLWNSESGEQISSLPAMEMISNAMWSPDSKILLTAHRDNSARVWNIATGQLVHFLRHSLLDATSRMNFVTYSPSGDAILTASEDHNAILWNANDGKAVKTLKHSKAIYHAAFSPDGRKLLTSSADKTASLWDRATGKKIHTFTHKDEVMQAHFHPSGLNLITVGADGDVVLRNAASGATLAIMQHPAAVTNAVFSTDGRRLATLCNDKVARLWDVASGEILTTFRREKKIYSLSISPDGNAIAIAGDDNMIQLFDCRNPQIISKSTASFQSYEDMANAVTGKKITSSGNVQQLSFDETSSVNDRIRTLSGETSPEAALWNKSRPESGTD